MSNFKKLSRIEMKNVIGGTPGQACNQDSDCVGSTSEKCFNHKCVGCAKPGSPCNVLIHCCNGPCDIQGGGFC